MAAHLARSAFVGVWIIVPVLPNPRLNRLRRRPVVVLSPEQVLAVRAVGVDHLAVQEALVGPAARVAGKLSAPLQDWLVEMPPHIVVGVEELPPYREVVPLR
jgi:hypothetical protein